MMTRIFFRGNPYTFYINLGFFCLIISLLAFSGTLVFPQQYRAYNTYFIDAQYPQRSDSVIDFSPQQLAEKTTDNIKGIIESKNFLGSVLEQAGYENTAKSREKLSKNILVKKAGPQVLYVQIKGFGESKILEKTIVSLTKVLRSEVSSINSNGNVLIALNEVNEAPNVEEVQLYPWLNAVLAFLVTGILGVSLFEFKKYIEK